MNQLQPVATDVPGASVALHNLPAVERPMPCLTQPAQILHIELWYSDGRRGEMNLTSPPVTMAMGSDVEEQWRFMRPYVESQHEALGIVRYRAHAAKIKPDGSIKVVWSWFAFDFITNQEIRE